MGRGVCEWLTAQQCLQVSAWSFASGSQMVPEGLGEFYLQGDLGQVGRKAADPKALCHCRWQGEQEVEKSAEFFRLRGFPAERGFRWKPLTL